VCRTTCRVAVACCTKGRVSPRSAGSTDSTRVVAAAATAKPAHASVFHERRGLALVTSAASREAMIRCLSSGGATGSLTSRSLFDTFTVDLDCSMSVDAKLAPNANGPVRNGSPRGPSVPHLDRGNAVARSIDSLYLTAQGAVRFLRDRQVSLTLDGPTEPGTVL